MTRKKVLKTPDELWLKPPPHEPELEAIVLGALLYEKGTYATVERYLKNEDIFYDEKNKKIFRAIKNCLEKYNACDIIIVTQEIRKMGLIEEISAFDIAKLTQRLASTANIVAHASMLYEKFIARKIILAGMQLVQKAYDQSDDVFLTLEDGMKILHDTESDIASLGNMDFKRQLSETMKQIQEAQRTKVFGIPTGLHNIDQITGGRVKGELTILAARPSMGKTARMIQEAMNIAIGQQIPVGIISLEMTFRQLITRKLANISGINSKFIRRGQLTDAEWSNLFASEGRLGTAPFFIAEHTDITVSDIRGIIRNWVQTEKVEIIYVDYLGLIKFQNLNGKPVDELSKISRGLKNIAKECDIPVVALAQLNRDVEKRPDKRPVLSDLRDSGAIEQDADVVSFLYRPEYYGIFQDAMGDSTLGVCEENIAKNRNGEIGKAWHRFIPEINVFEPYKQIALPLAAKELDTSQNAIDDTPW